MLSSVKLSYKSWQQIKDQIEHDYGKATAMISFRMKREVGCTPRDHKYFDENSGYYRSTMYLDFYDHNLKTMFLLRYGHLIEQEKVKF